MPDGPLAPPAPVALVVPPVWAQVFYPTALLLQHALEDLGVQADVVEYSGRFPHRLNVLLGWSLYPEPLPADCRYIIYQLEPLCLPHWQERLAEHRLLFERATAIWDYSRINLPFLQPLAASWVPLGFHPKMKEFARTSMAGALRAPIASLGLIEATTEATAEATAFLQPDGDLQPGWR